MPLSSIGMGGDATMCPGWLKSLIQAQSQTAPERLSLDLSHEFYRFVRGEMALPPVAECQGRPLNQGGGVRWAPGKQARKHAHTPQTAQAVNRRPLLTPTRHQLDAVEVGSRKLTTIDGGIRTPCQFMAAEIAQLRRARITVLPAHRLLFASPYLIF